MKLCLLTANLARHWSIDKIVEAATSLGFAGLEFRAESGHAHGVELEANPEQRRAIRQRIEDAYLEAAGIGTSSSFEPSTSVQDQALLDRTKSFVELAADVGARSIRVFCNNIPPEVSREACIRHVGERLRVIGEFATPFGVDVLLEMHGHFRYWGFARAAVELAAHPRVGIVYNCDERDLVAGSVASTYGRVRQLVRHVHMHKFLGYFPYPELFELLKADCYAGYLASEVLSDPPSTEEYLAMYAVLFRAWAGQPFFVTQRQA